MNERLKAKVGDTITVRDQAVESYAQLKIVKFYPHMVLCHRKMGEYTINQCVTYGDLVMLGLLR